MLNGYTPRAVPVGERPGRSGAGANRHLPRWTDNIRELEARLQSDRVLRQRTQLRDSGEAQAIALIKRQPASVRYDLTLADWAQQRGDNQTAIAIISGCCVRKPTTAMRASASYGLQNLRPGRRRPPGRRSCSAERRRGRIHEYAAAVAASRPWRYR